MKHPSLQSPLEPVVLPACRVVADGQISEISVVPWIPVGSDELSRLRAYATARGVELFLDGTGAIVVRGGLAVKQTPSTAWRRRLRSRWPAPRQVWAGTT
jgi:hypothetical protein